MNIPSYTLTAFCFAIIAIASCKQSDVIDLYATRVIKSSGSIILDTALIEGSQEEPAIQIVGNDITVDFDGCQLLGNADLNRPDHFKGVAIEVLGNGITIKNAKIAGFETGISAESSNDLRIIDCDLSYNYRPLLLSTATKQNDLDQLDLPDKAKAHAIVAALRLQYCDDAIISNVRIHQGQHGISLDNCNAAQITDSDIRYNSGIALIMTDSDSNEVKNNRLDYNIRGYHPSQWNNTQGSGILNIDESSFCNTFEHNSMTHSMMVSSLDGSRNVLKNNTFVNNDLSFTLDSFSPGSVDLKNIRPNESSFKTINGTSPTTTNSMHGKQFILINEWGPYNFEYPSIWLRAITGSKYTFALLGPEGNWRIRAAEGFQNGSLKSGTFPNSLTADRTTDELPSSITLEFLGPSFIDQFGQRNGKGNPYLFGFDSSTRTKDHQVK